MPEKTHIWFIQRDGPDEKTGFRAYLKRQLLDPFVLKPGPFGPLVRWFLIKIRSRNRSPQLQGPCPSSASAKQQTEELKRQLGSDYVCHIVTPHGDKGIEQAMCSTPAVANVILAPLIPHRCASLFSVLNRARNQLEDLPGEVGEIGLYINDEDYLEGIAEQVREGIIQLQGELSYGIVFMAGRQPESWNSPPEEFMLDVEACVSGVMKRISRNIPSIVAHSGNKYAKTQLEKWKAEGIKAILCVPLTWTCDASDLKETEHTLERNMAEADMKKFIFIEPLCKKNKFIKMLIRRIHKVEAELQAELN